MKQPLRNALKDHLEQQKLSDDKLDSLLAMQNNASECNEQTPQSNSEPHKPLLRAVTSYISIAAAVMVALLLLFEFGSSQSLPQQIAQEVAKNHIKMKPLEVETASIEGIQKYFNQLDFLPVNSAHFGSLFSDSSNTMLGGRYCSIKGITAAQLRYSDQNGNKITLYETEYDKSVFATLPYIEKGQEPLELYAKGIKVSIWVERGLLMVSAGE